MACSSCVTSSGVCSGAQMALFEVDAAGWAAYQITLGVKIMLVAISGVAVAPA